MARVRRVLTKPKKLLRGLLHPAFGPLLRGAVHSDGQELVRGLLIVDTGASMSAVDRDVARALGLPTHGAAQWHAVTDSDRPHTSALRRAFLSLGEDPRHWQLDLVEVANLKHRVEGYQVVALLGWDFLDQCRLEVDGPARTFSLTLPG
jgi:hypothetical protein